MVTNPNDKPKTNLRHLKKKKRDKDSLCIFSEKKNLKYCLMFQNSVK